MSTPIPAAGLTQTVAEKLRDQITEGRLLPGDRLSEAKLAADLEISRNTLREVFRMLTRDGLLRYELNRGVFVAEPSMATILDVYRIRRLIEVPALAGAHASQTGISAMRRAFEAGQAAADQQDWRRVGSANMEFHAAIVSLAESPRLTEFFHRLSAELRLAFGLLNSPEHLHSPYVARNRQILELAEAGDCAQAAQALSAYLDLSERNVLVSFAGLAGAK